MNSGMTVQQKKEKIKHFRHKTNLAHGESETKEQTEKTVILVEE